jgi:oligogalacturonide transport system substrate-binding protein
MKRLTAIALTATMAVSLLAGCGSSTSGTAATVSSDTADSVAASAETSASASSDTAAPSGEAVTLRFAWWGGDERNAATQEVIQQFEDAHPGVTIEGEPGSSDGYHDKLATQLASGTAADIVQIDPETMPTFVSTGDYFVDLNTTAMDMSLFDKDYIGEQINGNYDGKQLGLPTGIAGPAVLVNKDNADKFGIDMAKEGITWDDWIEYGKKVQEQDPESYLFCMNKEYIVNLFVLTMSKQYSVKVFDDQGKLVLTAEDLTKVFDYVKELYDNNVVAPASYQASYTGDDIQSDANWLAGKYVAAPCYISTEDVMAAGYPDANYIAGTLPVVDNAKDGGFASNTPQLLSITNTCKNVDTAVEFLNYFYNDKTAEETLGATRSVPPTEQARSICTENGSLTQVVSDSADIAVAVGGTPNDSISSSEEAKTILYDAVESIGYGESTPEDAAADVIDQLQGLQK